MLPISLLHYRIEKKLGQGGMGEVWLAHDTKLDRPVALKVLPAAFASDADRLARFEREARILAALSHPNVGAIHGLEDSQGVRFLVLDLVHGEGLNERLARGPLPVSEAIEVARQVADGVAAAHDRGVIHRDLKPDNIKITPEGLVKVLDFGLAKSNKLVDEAGGGGADSQAQSPAHYTTSEGVVLGTAPYMSPEQARGRPLDKRTDVWSFGCVLYEMLTGKRAFAAPTMGDTLAAILEREPDWSALPSATPPRVRRLLVRCLAKDSRRRLQDLGDARVELEDAHDDPESGIVDAPARGAPSWRLLVAIAVLVAATSAAAALKIGLERGRAAPSERLVTRFAVTLPRDTELNGNSTLAIALSPDGRTLAYSADRDDVTSLYLLRLDDLGGTAIPGTTRASAPFFSPDGTWLGFFAEGDLKKIALRGGAPITLMSDVESNVACWAADDTIIFPKSYLGGLTRVSAAGGAGEDLTQLDPANRDFGHSYPEMLPDGKHVLFTIWRTRLADAQIVVLSLETRERRMLLEGGSHARYASSGHLVYVSEGGLFAVPFDVDELAIRGAPVSVLEDVRRDPYGGRGQYALATNGTLAYVSGGARVPQHALVWVDRRGVETSLTSALNDYDELRLAPDGRRLAVQIWAGDGSDLWVIDLVRDASTRLTQEGSTSNPVWTADGRRIVFNSLRTGPFALFWKVVDGSTPEELLLERDLDLWPYDCSRDGHWLVFGVDRAGKGRLDLDLLALDDGRSTRPLLSSDASEQEACISPDGRWLAFVSRDAGERSQVYVQPFPDGGKRWQVSTSGGRRPRFNPRPGASELFYREDHKVMSVVFKTEPEFAPDRPVPLFDGSYLNSYDVAPDGERFVMVREQAQTEPDRVIVIENWTAELARLVPTER